MKTIYFLSLIGFLLFSCDNSRTTNAVDLDIKNIKGPPYNIELEKNLHNLKSVPLSFIGKDLKYIPLETTNSSVLERIKGIKLSGEYIFISDFNKLLQFDREGKFIRQIGSNGKGPGEYIYVSDFCLDEERKKVYILAWGINAILEFDFRGKFIGRSSKLPFNSSQVLVNDSSGFVFHVSDPPTNTNDSKNNLSFTDFECNSLFDIKRHFIRNSNFLVGRTTLYFSDGLLRFQQFGVDTLYTVKKEIMEPYAIFKLGLLKWIQAHCPFDLEVSKKLVKS